MREVDNLLKQAFSEPTLAEQEKKWRENPSIPRPILWQLRDDPEYADWFNEEWNRTMTNQITRKQSESS